MEITEVRIGPSDDERIAAYASITIDDCFVIHGLRVKVRKKGDYYLFMPGRKQADGTYVDIALPINNETRRMIVNSTRSSARECRLVRFIPSRRRHLWVRRAIRRINALRLSSERSSILAVIPAPHTHRPPSVAERRLFFRPER